MRRPNRLPQDFVGQEEFEGNLTIIDLVNDGTELPTINVKATPTSAITGDVVQIEADGTNWSGGSCLNLISDDQQASLITGNDGSNDVMSLDRAGALILASNITLTGGGNVITTANGKITILPNGSGITVIGDAGSTSHNLNTNDDLLVAGKLEVDGIIYADGHLFLRSNFYMGVAGASGMFYMGAFSQTVETIYIGTGSTSHHILIADFGDYATDFGHAATVDPTVFIQSGDATDVSQWLSYCHNQTNAVIESGMGGINLKPFDNTIIITGDENETTNIKTLSATLASVSGATVTATNAIPDGAFVVGISTFVSVGLGTGNSTSGYQVGDGSDVDRWGSITGTAQNTNSDNTDATADFTGAFTSASNVVLTAVGGNFDGTGSIVVTVHYMDIGSGSV